MRLFLTFGALCNYKPSNFGTCWLPSRLDGTRATRASLNLGSWTDALLVPHSLVWFGGCLAARRWKYNRLVIWECPRRISYGGFGHFMEGARVIHTLYGWLYPTCLSFTYFDIRLLGARARRFWLIVQCFRHGFGLQRKWTLLDLWYRDIVFCHSSTLVADSSSNFYEIAVRWPMGGGGELLRMWISSTFQAPWNYCS